MAPPSWVPLPGVRRLASPLRLVRDPGRFRVTVGERITSWRWPAVQVAVAAGTSYFLARWAAPDAASYAPIAAIATMGLGRERRPERGLYLVAGMFIGAVLAEIAARSIGLDWWQIGVLMGISALLAGLAFDEELAATYAAINAGVLLALPGSDGWLPTRVVAGAIGIATTVVVMLAVLPPHPVHQVGQRLDTIRRHARNALERTSDELDQRARPDHLADDRDLIVVGRNLDDAISRSRTTLGHAHQISRWSPWRRRQCDEVARLDRIATELRPALRTVSTIARLGDRMLIHQIDAMPSTRTALDETAAWVDRVVRSLVFDDTDDLAAAPDGQTILDGLRSADVEHAAEIALCEEIRGVVSDLSALIDHRLDRRAVDPGSDVLGRRDRPASLVGSHRADRHT